MKLFKAYSNGFIKAAKLKKMAALIYVITLIMALLLAVPFRTMLGKIAGNTTAINSLVKGFNFSTYSDFLRTAGHALAPFASAAIWFGILYLVFTVFFAGGVLKILTGEDKKFSARIFFESCAAFFFRFLRLAFYLLILQLIFAFIIFMPLGAILGIASGTVQNEASLFYTALAGIVIYLFFFLFILTIGDYAKIIIFINDSPKSFKSVWLSVKFVFKHFFSTYFLYLLLLIAPVLMFLIYFFLDSTIGMISGFTILVMFLIQQILVWLRTWIKIWFLGSELSLYELFPAVTFKNKVDETLQVVQQANENGSILGNSIS